MRALRLYHASPVAAREGILLDGLVPRRPNDQGHWMLDLSDQPRAVYAWPRRYLAEGWATTAGGPYRDHARFDVWRFDALPSELSWDKILRHDGAVVLERRVAPSELSLVGRGLHKFGLRHRIEEKLTADPFVHWQQRDGLRAQLSEALT